MLRWSRRGASKTSKIRNVNGTTQMWRENHARLPPPRDSPRRSRFENLLFFEYKLGVGEEPVDKCY